MLHWPGTMKPGGCNREQRAESWRALEELYEEGENQYNLIIHRLKVDLFGKVGEDGNTSTEFSVCSHRAVSQYRGQQF